VLAEVVEFLVIGNGHHGHDFSVSVLNLRLGRAVAVRFPAGGCGHFLFRAEPSPPGNEFRSEAIGHRAEERTELSIGCSLEKPQAATGTGAKVAVKLLEDIVIEGSVKAIRF